jgi:hypothetical protein
MKKKLKQKYTKKQLKEFQVMAENEIKEWQNFLKEVKDKLK